MGKKRQKNQMLLAFMTEGRDEVPMAVGEGTELSVAKNEPESLAKVEPLMEEVCQRGNLERALKRVQANQGSPGIDGMTVKKLLGYLRKHWPTIREQLLNGTYKPQPVKV